MNLFYSNQCQMNPLLHIPQHIYYILMEINLNTNITIMNTNITISISHKI